MQEHAIVEHFLTSSKSRLQQELFKLALGPCGSRASLADPCRQWSFIVVPAIAVDVASDCRTGVFASRTTEGEAKYKVCEEPIACEIMKVTSSCIEACKRLVVELFGLVEAYRKV